MKTSTSYTILSVILAVMGVYLTMFGTEKYTDFENTVLGLICFVWSAVELAISAIYTIKEENN